MSLGPLPNGGPSPLGPSLRTEADGETAQLRLRIGGQQVVLRPLTIEEGEAWQATMARLMTASIDMDDIAAAAVGPAERRKAEDESEDTPPAGPSPEEAFVILLGNEVGMRIKLIAAYDIENKLGGEGAIRHAATKVEVNVAFDTIMDAEFPFDEETKRSVVEAFGLPLKVMAVISSGVVDAASQWAKSLNGPSLTGVSRIPLSGGSGPANSSSSGGHTAKRGSGRKTATA